MVDLPLSFLFQNTNPERGRKLMIKALYREGKFPSFQNTNPERGRKRLWLAAIGAAVEIISEHEPRKGTETSNLIILFALCLRRISEHEPRKGTETLHIQLSTRINRDFRTRTPKGDGNLRELRTVKPVEQPDFRTRTPKGDGNQYI